MSRVRMGRRFADWLVKKAAAGVALPAAMWKSAEVRRQVLSKLVVGTLAAKEAADLFIFVYEAFAHNEDPKQFPAPVAPDPSEVAQLLLEAGVGNPDAPASEVAMARLNELARARAVGGTALEAKLKAEFDAIEDAEYQPVDSVAVVSQAQARSDLRDLIAAAEVVRAQLGVPVGNFPEVLHALQVLLTSPPESIARLVELTYLARRGG